MSEWPTFKVTSLRGLNGWEVLPDPEPCGGCGSPIVSIIKPIAVLEPGMWEVVHESPTEIRMIPHTASVCQARRNGPADWAANVKVRPLTEEEIAEFREHRT